MEARTDDQYVEILQLIAKSDEMLAIIELYTSRSVSDFDLPHEVLNAICEMSEGSCPYAEKQQMAAKIIAAGVEVQLALLIDFGCWSHDYFKTRMQHEVTD